MTKDRLLVYGDSLTYGDGLPDCHIPPSIPGVKPSLLGWPSIMSRYMNKTCVNRGSSGSSNKRIWHTIINTEYSTNDTVIILWTYPARYCIIKTDSIVDISLHRDREYYKYMYDDNDALLTNKLFVRDANNYLANKNVTVYNLVIGTRYIEIFDEHINHIPIYLYKIREHYRLALDNSHPGLDCNMEFARQLLNYLNIANDINPVVTINGNTLE